MSLAPPLEVARFGISARAMAARGYHPSLPPQPINLWLDANEGSAPPAEWLASIQTQSFSTLARYPRPDALERVVARDAGVSPERVIVTAGADDALERICRCVLEPGTSVVLADPTFDMVRRYATLAGAEVRAFPWLESQFDREALIARIDETTRLIYLASPNNPTGLAITPEDVAAISSAAPNVLFVLDLAYTEFADVELAPVALALPNVVITKTMSKAWGLAGLRVGWAIGPVELIGRTRAVGQPYAVAGASLAVAENWLEDGLEIVQRRVERTKQERRMLESTIRRLGGRPIESQANFVLASFDRADVVADLLASLGIAVRRFGGAGPTASYLRITCPGEQRSFDRLLSALDTALAPQAVLFDMDGVLADVSESYREAIVRTAATFGVAIDRKDIANAKSQGHANNDWLLTQRLLAARGIDAALAEVTARFESIYQGTAAAPGLWTNERLIVRREWLAALASRYPLGIATGRPRKDAERFLDSFGIGEFFGSLVCMEDACIKPDPAPIRLAAAQLGIERAWYIGDTPDDAVAARAASAIAIGVRAPGDSSQSGDAALLAAGAARVLVTAEQLTELLP